MPSWLLWNQILAKVTNAMSQFEKRGHDGPVRSGGKGLESQRSDDVINMKLGMFIAC